MERVVEWLRTPEVPVTVTDDVPRAAFAAAVKVIVDPAAELAGEKLAVTPDGRPVAANVTKLVNVPDVDTAI